MQHTDRARPDILTTRMHDRRGRTSIRAATPLVVVAMVVAACASTPSPAATNALATPPPSVSVSPSSAPSLAPPSIAPSPSEPAATQAAGAAPCEPSDLKASHGLVEGGAGSVFTTVVLVAAVPCSVDLWPAVGLKDADGAALVNGVSGGPGRIELDPKVTYQSNVRLGNWCEDEPAFPLQLELLMAGAEKRVTGGSFPEEGNLPPCSGDAVGRVLEAQPWEVVP